MNGDDGDGPLLLNFKRECANSIDDSWDIC